MHLGIYTLLWGKCTYSRHNFGTDTERVIARTLNLIILIAYIHVLANDPYPST